MISCLTISYDIDIYSTLGDVAIIGDINSWVGLHQETHYDIDIDSHNGDLAQPAYVNPRNNSDLHVNTHGRKLTNHDDLWYAIGQWENLWRHDQQLHMLSI